MRNIGIIDFELRLVAIRRRAARDKGEPLPPIDAVDALLDERLRADRVGYNPRAFLEIPGETPGMNRCPGNQR